MKVAIHLTNQLVSAAISHLLRGMGEGITIASEQPDILLVDVTSLSNDLLSRYPEANVLLIDSGMEQDKLCATLLSYRIHGILSGNTELHLFKKALKAISEGQIWLDNGSLKTVLHNRHSTVPTAHLTDREQEIVEYVCKGLKNDEIAQRLALSPSTVKAHLNSIFRKLQVTSRSKLMALATQHPRQHPE